MYRKKQRILGKMLLIVIVALSFSAQMWATTFIKELGVATAGNADDAKNALKNAGYTPIYTDINSGCGGDYVYIGYKTTTNIAEAITDIRLSESSSGFSYDGRSYQNATCVKNSTNLNKGTGTKTRNLYIHYAKTGNTYSGYYAITSVSIQSSNPGSYYRVACQGDKSADLRATKKGSTTYFWFYRGHNHRTTDIGTYSSSQHKKYCSDCGYVSSYVNHSFAYANYDDTQHKYYCTVCGYVYAYYNHSHSYTSNNATQHIDKCSTCGRSKYENHSKVYTNINNATYHKTTCQKCTYSVTTDTHTITGHVCTGCNYKDQITLNFYNGDNLVKTTTAKPYTSYTSLSNDYKATPAAQKHFAGYYTRPNGLGVMVYNSRMQPQVTTVNTEENQDLYAFFTHTHHAAYWDYTYTIGNETDNVPIDDQIKYGKLTFMNSAGAELKHVIMKPKDPDTTDKQGQLAALSGHNTSLCDINLFVGSDNASENSSKDVLEGEDIKVYFTDDQLSQFTRYTFEAVTDQNGTPAEKWITNTDAAAHNTIFSYKADNNDKLYNLHWTVKLTGLLVYPEKIYVKPMQWDGTKYVELASLVGTNGITTMRTSSVEGNGTTDLGSATYTASYPINKLDASENKTQNIIGLVGFDLNGKTYYMDAVKGNIHDDMVAPLTYNEQTNVSTTNSSVNVHIDLDGSKIPVMMFTPNGGAFTGTTTQLYIDETRGDNVNLAQFTAARENYNFVGWYDVKRSTTYQPSADFPIKSSGATTFAAIWQRNSAPTAEVNGTTERTKDNVTYGVKFADAANETITAKYIISTTKLDPMPTKDSEGWQDITLTENQASINIPTTSQHAYIYLLASNGAQSQVYESEKLDVDVNEPTIEIDSKYNEGGNSLDVVVSVTDDCNIANAQYQVLDAPEGTVKTSGSIENGQANFNISGMAYAYIKITATDAAGNQTIKTTEKIKIDNIAPVIKFVIKNSNGADTEPAADVCAQDVKVTFSDNYGIKSVTLQENNGTPVEQSTTEDFTITKPATGEKTYKITVTDIVDNVTEQEITIHAQHAWNKDKRIGEEPTGTKDGYLYNYYECDHNCGFSYKMPTGSETELDNTVVGMEKAEKDWEILHHGDAVCYNELGYIMGATSTLNGALNNAKVSSVLLTSNTELGNTTTLATPTNEVQIDLNGNKLLANSQSVAEITANNKVTILLNDNGETNYANEATVKGAKLEYHRDFASEVRAGKWQALYLPFYADISGVEYNGYDFGRLKYVDITNNSAVIAVEKLDRNNLEEKILSPNTPYFVRTADGKVDITATEELKGYTVPVENNVYNKDLTTVGTYTIRGSFLDTDNAATNSCAYWVMTNGGTFAWVAANSHQRPYHWVIYDKHGSQPTSARNISIVEIESDATTGISSIETADEEVNKAIYTLDGRKVSSNGALAPGMYIIGTKKVIIN